VSDAHRAVEAVWRIESARLIAGLARLTGDVGLAEDLAQDAFLAALEQWPSDGVPDRPGAWLMTAARRRGIDQLRRRSMTDAKHAVLAGELTDAERRVPHLAAAIDDDIGDDLLRLIFIACHPVLSTDARAALTLRLVGGLTTEEIARAFLAPVGTIQQRIVRAKRTLSEARVPFELPRGDERSARLESVLGVIYLIFNEGHSATAGDDVMRPELMRDALRIGRILAELTPGEADVHGLVALMELTASRTAARVDRGGAPVLLLEQDRGRWDRLLIGRGLAALDRAVAAGPLGPYALQAAIAACHARAREADATDWPQIAALYDALAQVMPSPIVALNRAMAVGMAYGPEAGLALLDSLTDEPKLAGYHLLSAARADLLERLGRGSEAGEAFERAAGLTANARERELLFRRAAMARRG
jgi:RNA polymerase sigma factor (sigma-70 family)